MKISPWLWIPVVMFGLVIALRLGCHSAVLLKPAIAARFPHVQWVDTETLSRWVKRAPEKQPTLLDVRTEAEFEVSHLRGAHRVDPDERKIEPLHIAPEATVVVYCSVGYRSAAIVEQIQRAGVRTVYNLEGGIFAWANQGHPVYRENERAELVHPYNKLWGRLLREDLRAPLPKEP
jgi:rhodanese-related sulfurtransferase